jgi:prophage tail gpP-like protein
MANIVTVRASGRSFTAFRRVDVEHALDGAALAFKPVIAAELGAAPTAEAMKPGTAIDIHFDGDLACRGFVDRYQPRSDGHEGREILELVQRSVRAGGRRQHR